jgi:hypothetical protein
MSLVDLGRKLLEVAKQVKIVKFLFIANRSSFYYRVAGNVSSSPGSTVWVLSHHRGTT